MGEEFERECAPRPKRYKKLRKKFGNALFAGIYRVPRRYTVGMPPPSLPPLVEAYCRRNLRSPQGHGTLLQQTGEIRLSPEQAWMPFTAEQRIVADRTQFIWHARVKMAPLVTAVVEDAYEGGRGRLDAKIWGVLPVAHARGLDVDRGEAERYLAELPWCPQAFKQNSELQFEPLDERSVRVWVGDPETYVDLLFDADGDISGARTTTRVRGESGATPWQGRFWDYADFGDWRAPTRGEVWWDTAEGKFLYWRGQITALSAG